MGYWAFYFVAKLLLYAGGHLDLHVGVNLAFAALCALPPANPRQRLAKLMLTVPLGIGLLYHDSWLPPLPRVIESAPALADFSAPYLVELLARLVDGRAVLVLMAAFGLFLVVRRKLRVGTFAVVGLVVAGLLPPPGIGGNTPAAHTAGAAPGAATASLTPDALDAQLASFRHREATRRIDLPVAASGAPYDLIIVHVCSLAWDDLRTVGMQEDPFFDRFDVLFTHFNSAASYSGPAAIRLLRANCGQSPHRDLYSPAQPACYLIGGLERAGFEPHWLMNHDGHFGNFYADVRVRGGVGVLPEPNNDAAIAQHAFDGTPVYDDYSVLAGWWKRRLASGAPRAVLYYNTISLHDGNHLDNAPALGTVPGYARRARLLFQDIGRFMDDIRRSGRRAVVVFVPEHGAALRGERRQIQGLREIPSAAITQVPVGVAFIGAAAGDAPHQHVDRPTSYLALAELLGRTLATDPLDATDAASRKALVAGLPDSLPVAENEGTLVIDVAGTEQMHGPDGLWSRWEPGR